MKFLTTMCLINVYRQILNIVLKMYNNTTLLVFWNSIIAHKDHAYHVVAYVWSQHTTLYRNPNYILCVFHIFFISFSKDEAGIGFLTFQSERVVVL